MGAWLAAFAFTQLVEVPIYRRLCGTGYFASFGASAITHPIVWFGMFGGAWHASYLTKAVVAELFAWGVEALYFKVAFKVERAWLWSLVANASSVALAIACRAAFGGP